MAAGGAAAQPRWLLRREVAARAGQRWVSARGRGLRLGPFLRDRQGDPQLRPLLEAAGSDVSHWFDPQTGDPLTRVDPQSGLLCCCVPGGPGGAPPEPRSDWAPPETPPWWEDPRLEVGRLTAAPQHLRLCNTLTGQEHVIEACGEQAGGLVERALPWNAHVGGYAWRCGGAPLHPDQPPPAPDRDGSPPHRPPLLHRRLPRAITAVGNPKTPSAPPKPCTPPHPPQNPCRHPQPRQAPPKHE
ncbi:cytochrome b5 domain-containing protein 1 isoform X1 [Aquila chrysaetos chrysaetos]|uniref:cytochrome b5 domain-containing protein 1 isoform X1 n=1 Tax=Aquila chrysaetos chrysaetos TaxID=223781 RepID=UPI0011765431|nr:cytochrome b5 domain-containing protein 1 isoform X1 [Aquila chrysaetos chrysaetos]